MNLKEIQELIKFVAKSGATEVDLEIDNVKISIKSPSKKRRGTQQHEEPMTVIQQVPAVQQIQPVPQTMNQEVTAKEEKEKPSSKQETDNDEGYITINASMIGTFYRSSSPESPPFVNVGDSIKKGDVLCIIEAMKLFNEIESEVNGKVIKVLVDDSTPVEFDQPLFLIDPS
tara:strand:- start:1182 stop:1697 length:516 start_codon:yes stop_codon:yes gene_type:complete